MKWITTKSGKRIKVQKKSEWVSVKDRLPELYVDVLVFTKGGIIAIDYLDVDAMVYENFHNYWNYVTHWMPLPEPPESEDDAE